MTKTILITGATAGIGKATAFKFAESGYRLIINGRREDLLAQTAKDLHASFRAEVMPLAFDVRNRPEVQKSLDGLPANWRNIDILVNNAGLAAGLDPVQAASPEDWDTMIDTNIKGLLYVTRIVVPWMIENSSGQYLWPDRDGRAWTRLHHGDSIRVGNIELKVLHTPGHTPEHLAFLVTDRGAGASEPMALLAGDFVFVGDLGRPDLLESAAGVHGAMEPSARRLYASAREFLALPEWIQVWPGHGAGSACGKAVGAVPSQPSGTRSGSRPRWRRSRRGSSRSSTSSSPASRNRRSTSRA